MRISDWSSDVCSSDLGGYGTTPSVTMASAGLRKNTGWPRSAFDAGAVAPISFAWSAELRPTQKIMRTGNVPPPDRKSVGEGKSVTVRVDLGGLGIINKQRTKKALRKQVA